MVTDIHNKSGTHVGFHYGNLIYDLHGRVVCQLRGSHAYCMAGHYVGELEDGIILDRNLNYGTIGRRGTGRRRQRGADHP